MDYFEEIRNKVIYEDEIFSVNNEQNIWNYNSNVNLMCLSDELIQKIDQLSGMSAEIISYVNQSFARKNFIVSQQYHNDIRPKSDVKVKTDGKGKAAKAKSTTNHPPTMDMIKADPQCRFFNGPVIAFGNTDKDLIRRSIELSITKIALCNGQNYNLILINALDIFDGFYTSNEM